jgi:hypothetical protein
VPARRPIATTYAKAIAGEIIAINDIFDRRTAVGARRDADTHNAR